MSDKDRTKICEIMSEMLDNPDDCGIYPTTIAYDKLEKLVEDTRSDERAESIGWAYADCCVTLDRGSDPRQTLMSGVLERANADLDDKPVKEEA